MIAIGNNTPGSYRLISITVSNNEGNQIDVTNMLEGFRITESIYDMFLTGNIVLIDNQNIFNRIGFTGQEYIRIHFSGIQGLEEEVPEDEQINQVFRVYNVSHYHRDTEINLNNVVFSLDFCSPLLYEARTKRISRIYRGQHGKIINDICRDELNFIELENTLKPSVKGGKELGNFFSLRDPNVGDVAGFLCPNWTVYKALEYLRDNTSNDSQEAKPYGDSYYLYQTCLNGFRFHNVASMRTIEYLDGDVAFAPRMASQNIKENYDFVDGGGNDILNYNKSNTYNTLSGHTSGLYSGKALIYNTITKQLTEIDNEYTQQFEIDTDGTYKNKKLFGVSPPFRLGEEGIRSPADGAVEDGNPLEVAPKSLEGDAITKRYGAAVHFSYSAPSTFSNKLGDEGNSVSSGGETTKFNRQRVEALFERNRINIQIPGRTNISAGMTINVQLPMPTATGEREEILHNGSLLVEGVTWIGTRDGLEVQLSCTTDGHQVNMDKYEGMTLDQQY